MNLLAFRPARVAERLPPRNDACPLSLCDVLAGAAAHAVRLPLVRAPLAGVARAALLAAKQARSALGLGLPAGAAPEPWFDAVAGAADELAPGLPIFLSGEVAVAGGGGEELERARRQAWRLVDAGVTHLAVDVQAVPPGRRAEAVERVGEPAREREIAVDVVLPLEAGLPSPALAAVLLEELARRRLGPDVASARCPLPAGEAEERAQERLLVDLCRRIAGVPVLRRGPLTPGMLAALASSPIRACEDGGAAQAAAARALGLAVEADAGPALSPGRDPPPEIGDRPEALAYVEAAAFVEALGGTGSAPEVAAALLRRAAEG